MRRKTKTTPKTKGTRGPPSDDTLKRLALLSRGWRADAEETLLVLQKKIRERAEADLLDTFELIGAIRTIGETLTTNQALIPDVKPGDAP